MSSRIHAGLSGFAGPTLYGDAALQRAEDLLARRERFFGIAMPGIDFDGCEMHHRLLAAYDKVHRLHLQQSAKA